MPLRDYEVTWDGAPISVDKAILKIKDDEYPDDLVIFHMRHGTVHVSRTQFGESDYIVSYTGPSPFGRGGLARANAAAPINKKSLMNYINEKFPTLETEISAAKKLLALQLTASRRLTNQVQGRIGKNVPNDIQGVINEGIGKPLSSDAEEIRQNFSRINTSLFQGGKKKKTRKSKKAKKTTRRRR